MTVPCGQCLNCRINKRDQWAARILLERHCSFTGQFWTLTLSDEGLEQFQRKGPKDLFRQFINSLKRSESRAKNPMTIRFFGVLEYGPLTDRPHFHLALYNHVKNHLAATPYLPGLPRPLFNIGPWPHGHIDCQDLNPKSARYLAKYVTKFDDTDRENMNFPPKRPPLGYGGLVRLAEDISKSPTRGWEITNSIQLDGRTYFLDATMRKHWQKLTSHLKQVGMTSEEKTALMVSRFIEAEALSGAQALKALQKQNRMEKMYRDGHAKKIRRAEYIRQKAWIRG